MNKNKKLKLLSVFSAVIISAAMAVNTAVLVSADSIKTADGIAYRYSDSGEQLSKYTGWAKNSKGRRYYKNGVLYKNKWIKLKSGKRFHAGEDGYLTLGWYKTDDGWCYFNETTGEMAVGETEIYGKTYTFSKNGIWDGLSDYGFFKISSKLKKMLSKDDYGGVYYDDEAAVVMSKNTENVVKVTDELKKLYAPIIIKECAFSLNELESVKEHLKNNMKKYGIWGVGIHTMDNYVGVEMYGQNDDFDAYLETLDDSGIIHVEYSDGIWEDD
ncbi:MAG: hypothetical protein ACI4JK_04385 [Oscillospiraceae bacterium]